MLLTAFRPPFHSPVNVPRGVAFAVPGGPGSIRTGPKVTLPSDCSQVRCLDRSTHAAAARGHERWSRAVSASDPAGTEGGLGGGPGALAMSAASLALPGVAPGPLGRAARPSAEPETATYAATPIITSAVDA